MVRTRREYSSQREILRLKWNVQSSDEAIELELKHKFGIIECHVVVANDKHLAEILQTKM